MKHKPENIARAIFGDILILTGDVVAPSDVSPHAVANTLALNLGVLQNSLKANNSKAIDCLQELMDLFENNFS